MFAYNPTGTELTVTITQEISFDLLAPLYAGPISRNPIDVMPEIPEEGIEDLLFTITLEGSGQIFDTKSLVVPFQTASRRAQVGTPEIVNFTTPADSVSVDALSNGTARLDVLWQVINRPANTTLIFEQYFADDESFINVELPRENPYVASSGQGIVAPLPPFWGFDYIELSLRMVNVLTGEVLDSALIQVPVSFMTSEPEEPQLIRFDATPQTASPGETITVNWEVAGPVDTVQIYAVYDDIISTSQSLFGPVETAGSRQFTLPETVRTVDLWFVEPQFNQNIQIAVECQFTWFAGDNPGCPLTPPTNPMIAYQPFERGFMLWIEPEIWVFFGDGTGYILPDTWDGSPVIWNEAPPTDLFQPERGFGWLWTQNGYINARLGWATAPEQGFTTTLQSGAFQTPFASGMSYAFVLPDGTVRTAEVFSTQISWR